MGQHRIAESNDSIDDDVTEHNGRNRPKQLHCSASWVATSNCFWGGLQDSAFEPELNKKKRPQPSDRGH
jgi:hypothetical protein